MPGDRPVRDEVVMCLPNCVAPFRWPAWFRNDGGVWRAWCPVVNVMTQARTKERASERLQEAVDRWVASRVERGVLDEALAKAGIVVTDAF